MIVDNSEQVTMWPYGSHKAEVVLDYGFSTDADEDFFYFEVCGEHLPEGTSGQIDSFFCNIGLNPDKAKELYEELGQWLKRQDGSS